MNNDNTNQTYKPFIRKLALITVVIIVLLMIATLIVAVFGGPDSLNILAALIFCDIVIPIMLYAYITVTRQIKKQADTDVESNISSTNVSDNDSDNNEDNNQSVKS